MIRVTFFFRSPLEEPTKRGYQIAPFEIKSEENNSSPIRRKFPVNLIELSEMFAMHSSSNFFRIMKDGEFLVIKTADNTHLMAAPLTSGQP